MALKSVLICDCCGKELEAMGVKFVQPVAFTKLPPNPSASSSSRVDVKGSEFCSADCMLNAFTQALTQL